jgi:MFS family permease
VTAAFVLNGIGIGSWAARVPAVQERLGLSNAQLGLALFGIALGAIVAMVLTGVLVERLGSRLVLRVTSLLFAGSLALPAAMPGLALLTLALIAMGASSGAMDVSMNAHGVEVENGYGRPILASMHAAFSAGGLAGAGIGAAAAAVDVDARVHLAGVACATLVGVWLAGRFLLPRIAAPHAEPAPLLARPPRRLLALGAIAFLCMLAEGSAADWSAVYLARPLAASAAVSALGFAAFSAAMVACRLIGDRVLARAGEARVLVGGAAIAAGGLGVALLVGRPLAGVLGFACLGVGLAGIVPIAFRSGATTPGVAPGVGLAAVATAGYTGFLVGPPAIGVLASVTTLPRALVVVVVAVAAIAPLTRFARLRRSAASLQSPSPLETTL